MIMGNCCLECFNDLKSICEVCSNYWKFLCEDYGQQFLRIEERKIPELQNYLKRLESLGYITTADARLVQMRLNGYACKDGVVTFCLDRKKHDLGNSQDQQESNTLT